MTAPTAASPPLPLRNCYWVLPGQVLAGEYPGSSTSGRTKQRLGQLVTAGIEAFLDLTRPQEMPRYDQELPGNIHYRRSAIEDHGLPSRRQMVDILDFLHETLTAGRPIYVHCRAGIGRTGIVMGCLLADRGLTGEQALRELNRLWQQCRRSKSWVYVPETDEQIEYVRSWKSRAAETPSGRNQSREVAPRTSGAQTPPRASAPSAGDEHARSRGSSSAGPDGHSPARASTPDASNGRTQSRPGPPGASRADVSAKPVPTKPGSTKPVPTKPVPGTRSNDPPRAAGPPRESSAEVVRDRAAWNGPAAATYSRSGSSVAVVTPPRPGAGSAALRSPPSVPSAAAPSSTPSPPTSSARGVPAVPGMPGAPGAAGQRAATTARPHRTPGSTDSDPLLEPDTLSAAHGLRERFVGALVGLAVGDAVAAATQYRRPGTFTPVGDMIGGGPFDLPRGAWSDDTSMALCLVESLLESNGFDARDQVTRYVRWQQDGYLSSVGHCVGITASTARALAVSKWRRQVFAGSHDPKLLDPEPLSRVGAPVLFYFSSLETAIQQAADAARPTCQAPAVLDDCRTLARALHAALSGQPKASIVAGTHFPAGAVAQQTATSTGVLQAALWAFSSTDTYRDAVLRAANLGGNSDVVASVCGQLAGAHYGLAAIPAPWRNSLMQQDLIESYGDRLLTQCLLTLGS